MKRSSGNPDVLFTAVCGVLNLSLIEYTFTITLQKFLLTWHSKIHVLSSVIKETFIRCIIVYAAQKKKNLTNGISREK